VTYDGSLIELDNLNEPLWFIQQVVFSQELSDSSLDFLIGLLLNISLIWEDISEKRKEKWDILSDELGQVHISQGTSHDHFLIGTWWFLSLGVTGSSEYGKNVSKTEIIMTLLGQLLFAKLIEHIEFLGQWYESRVTDRGELDHDNDSSVGDHHTYTSEQYLKVLWKLLTTSITWVHCNEVSACFDEDNWLLLIWEHESLGILLFGLSDGLNLSGDDREGSERDTVELIEATPETRLANTLEDLGHISIFMLIRAVGDDDENT
jgi:hypothetical protein